MKLVLFLLVSVLLLSCYAPQDDFEFSVDKEIKQSQEQVDSTQLDLDTSPDEHVKDSFLRVFNLVDIQLLNSQIMVDLKYASTDNFMGIQLYERLKKAYLQEDVAIRLGKCQDYLSSIDSSLHLLVYDAVRPVSVQFKMWNALDSIPVSRRGKFVSSPYGKSIHNYGAAVDLTICDANGKAIDMGAGFDDIREIAYPSKEAYYLSKGELTSEHIKNRELLRKVMRSQGFRNLQTEWWHFNAWSREEASKKYKLLEVEP